MQKNKKEVINGNKTKNCKTLFGFLKIALLNDFKKIFEKTKK